MQKWPPPSGKNSKIGPKNPIETHSESVEPLPRQKFPVSEFEHLHKFRDHILFLTDMMPNLKFNGYNREKLIQDQYSCPELGPAMKFFYGENADD